MGKYFIAFTYEAGYSSFHDLSRLVVKTAQGISERYDIEVEKIGCDKDHIHLLCSAHPKKAPGQIVRVFRSITAKEIINLFGVFQWSSAEGMGEIFLF